MNQRAPQTPGTVKNDLTKAAQASTSDALKSPVAPERARAALASLLPVAFALLALLAAAATVAQLRFALQAQRQDELARAAQQFEQALSEHLARPQKALLDLSQSLQASGIDRAGASFDRSRFLSLAQAREAPQQGPVQLEAHSLGFIERLKKVDDQTFIESTRQADQAPGFNISSFGESNALPDRFVVRALEPRAHSRLSEGLDLGSDLLWRQALDAAVTENRATFGYADEGAISSQTGKKAWSLLLFKPLYSAAVPKTATLEQKKAFLTGVLVAALPFGGLSNARSSSPGEFDFELQAAKKDGSTVTVLPFIGALTSALNARTLSRNLSHDSAQAIRQVSVGGVNFSIRSLVMPSRSQSLEHSLWAVILALGLVLIVFALLLTRSEHRLRGSSGPRKTSRNGPDLPIDDLSDALRPAGLASGPLVELPLPKLERSLSDYMAMCDGLPVGLTIVDRRGRIINCNAAAQRILGCSKDELLLHDPFAPGDRLQLWSVLDENGACVEPGDQISTRSLMANAPVCDEVTQMVLKTRRVWLSSSAMPIVGPDVNIYAAVAFMDITQQRSALVDAKQFAEQASQSKSQFLANMSHEIRTPMNAVLGMLALLRKTHMTPRQADYAAKTESAARSLLGLLNDILDFSKVEAGKMSLDCQVFEVDAVLQSLSVILSANASGKPLELVYEIDPALPKYLTGDAMRIQQVLINLGGNAVKFTSQGEIVISVRCLAVTDGQASVEFSIKDSGIGIALENQGKIFEGFTQAEASTTRRFGGTGLGVAICQRLVALMGGRLELQSELGRGATFFFQLELPVGSADAFHRQQGHDHDHERDHARDEPSDARGPAVCAVRTLIVDDSPTARRSLETSVKSLGWTSESVDSGEKAVALVKQQPDAFDLVLVDWTMPGLNGWQTCKALKLEGSGLGGAKLFMVTAQGRDMLATRSQDEQAMLTGFVVKPVTPKMLSDARKTALLEENLRLHGQPATSALSAPAAARLQGLRILVAEDNALNQQVARELLEFEGARVEIVNNGLAAVQALTGCATAYDIVLMDLQMPVMDGLSATQHIRSELQLTRLPIVAMTANAMAHDRQACLEGGMNEHVGKPFDLDHLVAVILRLTGENKLFQIHGFDSKAIEISDHSRQLSTLCGIELSAALARMGGNVGTYGRLLKSFQGALASSARDMHNSLARGDHEHLSRQAHTLKGLSATLGMTHLSALSASCEEVFKNASLPASQAQLDELVAALPSISTHLEAFSNSLLPQVFAAPSSPALTVSTVLTAAADSVPADTGVIVQHIERLVALLKDADMEAVSVVERLRGVAWGHWRAHLQPIDDDVVELKFDDALLKCKNLLRLQGQPS